MSVVVPLLLLKLDICVIRDLLVVGITAGNFEIYFRRLYPLLLSPLRPHHPDTHDNMHVFVMYVWLSHITAEYGSTGL